MKNEPWFVRLRYRNTGTKNIEKEENDVARKQKHIQKFKNTFT